MTPTETRVAIVGIGGLFPGAADLAGFWANVKAARDCSSEPPPGRWPIAPERVLDPRPVAPDKVPTLRGYYLPPFSADLKGMDLGGWPVAELDPVFHLALQIGNAAWRSAVTAPVDRSRCGVILGNIALPTETTNAIARDVLGPQLGLFGATSPTNRLNRYTTGLPAALVARGLGFGLGGYALDAACASSLYAVKLACDELIAGRADALIAGGMVRPDSLYTQMGFAQLRALSPSGRCAPFDRRADGLVVGEGGCAFVLKRLADAIKHGDVIHGVIAGVGLSNDVEGNVLQPASEGQLRALRAAYQRAGWRPSDVSLIECHATGTPTGDAVEFESLRQLWKGESGRAVLGGVKSTVGHLLTGAGSAALAKVLFAIHDRTLPPTANFERPSAKLGYERGPFRILSHAEPWDSKGPRRAAVNGFGFGGINAHLLIEEWTAEPGAIATGGGIPPMASDPGSPGAVAVVGIASRFGAPIESLTIPVGRFHIPPKELEEMLPQQTLMLQVAGEALDDTSSTPGDGLRTGVFVGVSLDPNTANYHLRWMAGEIDETLKDLVHPALTANRTMGSLASIAASRVARFLAAGGPSFAVCDEEAGGLRSVVLAAEALRKGEIDRALVGAVEFATDPRYGGSMDGAAAVILKRLTDAQRDGDRVYAVIGETSTGAIAMKVQAACGAATGLLDVVAKCRDLRASTSIAAGNAGGFGVRIELNPAPAETRSRRSHEQRKTTAVGPAITLPVGYHPKPIVRADTPIIQPAAATAALSPVVLLAAAQTETAQAHNAFLQFATAVQSHFAQTIAWQTRTLPASAYLAPEPQDTPRSLDFERCVEFARGRVGNVLGPRYAEIDSLPTRVRLPDGPLQLVDRIVTTEGEPLSMTSGRVVTEHLVHDGRWYLEHGRAPGCISIEAGQADLFLSGFLGIDFKTRGLACYRLLDAAVTFHRELPKIGELIRYDIRIDHFFRQGDTYLFRFRFDGTVNGEPLLTMRDGCAGFFTAEELAAGKGVVHTALDLKPVAGVKPADWSPPVSLREESLAEAQVDALRAGDLVSAFGREFGRANLRSPMRLPGGMLKLVDRVESIEPTGGRYGLGRIRCEADIHPDDWFLTCHFVDDQVMPGTLMYECCLHTMRVLLMRMGWVAEDSEAGFEPVPGVSSRLRCRGQVIATTRTVMYEVAIKEIGFRPEPYAIADALMYADGKAIVEVKDISLKMSGMTRARLDEIWSDRSTLRAEREHRRSAAMRAEPPSASSPRNGDEGIRRGASNDWVVFSRDQVLEFATGSPSKAYGDRYCPFDGHRFIARLPAPPYSFLDRITRVENCQPWKLAAGGGAIAEYDVPADAWYFAANRCDRMPYSVVNEIALQACGWMAAYLGAALTSPEDLHFRNLGGNAVQHAEVGPNSGTLTTSVKLKSVAPAAGMIILAFDFAVRRRDQPVYSGETTFGFFTKSALANQVGLTAAKLNPDIPGWSGAVSSDPPFPDPMLRMVDRIVACTTDGEPSGFGAVEGRACVNPDAWFFQAHFYKDPVWPGSLGLESLVQLMKVYAQRRWGNPANGWQAMVPDQPHKWTYRGQIVPTATEVTIQAYITDVDDDRRFLKADGLLGVDGRVIYQMSDFTLHG